MGGYIKHLNWVEFWANYIKNGPEADPIAQVYLHKIYSIKDFTSSPLNSTSPLSDGSIENIPTNDLYTPEPGFLNSKT